MPAPGRVLTEVEALLPTLLSHAGGMTREVARSTGQAQRLPGEHSPDQHTHPGGGTAQSLMCFFNAWDGPPLSQHLANVRLSHSDRLRCCHSPTREDTEAA